MAAVAAAAAWSAASCTERHAPIDWNGGGASGDTETVATFDLRMAVDTAATSGLEMSVVRGASVTRRVGRGCHINSKARLVTCMALDITFLSAKTSQFKQMNTPPWLPKQATEINGSTSDAQCVCKTTSQIPQLTAGSGMGPSVENIKSVPLVCRSFLHEEQSSGSTVSRFTQKFSQKHRVCSNFSCGQTCVHELFWCSAGFPRHSIYSCEYSR